MAISTTPEGKEMALYLHDGSYSIRVDGRVLMNSRQHESELELARLGCARTAGRKDGSILIGGLGLGYSLRQCLDIVGPEAAVTVCEFMAEVIEWNREHLGELTGHPLRDPRVQVKTLDIVHLLTQCKREFDVILLDVDNGPSAMAHGGNRRLYGRKGIEACRRALTANGCLAVWSVEPDQAYEEGLARAGFAVRRHRVPAYKGSRSQSRFVFVASSRAANLPPGGGEPRWTTPNRRR
jgi:spermidine synthase